MKKPLIPCAIVLVVLAGMFFLLCSPRGPFASKSPQAPASVEGSPPVISPVPTPPQEGASAGDQTLDGVADAGKSGSRVGNALRTAQRIAARSTGLAEFDAFNGWVSRYLAAPENEKASLLSEGVAFAEARRSTLANLIQTEPKRAIDNAVPPIVRQELPAAVVARIEERVNEQAFFGVLGSVPGADAAETPAYRRQVRTDDGGIYQAATFGARNSQRTSERSSIVGIAVDDILAVDERQIRIVESGEIPNHPNNLTRSRTVVPLDEKGFVLGREVIGTPTPPRPIVESCPVSGKSTAVPAKQDGSAAAVTDDQVVVEASGQFYFLCSGGHISTFEEQLIAAEGGNGGPVLPTNPPSATQSTGYKTNLLMRVAFPEALKGSVTEKEGYDLGKTVQDWFLDTSYGAMTFMTTVTSLIVLPRSEAWYKDQDTSGSAYEVLNDARVAAKLAGFDPANFNFDTVIYTGAPGGFGGQAYVGAKGCWLKTGTGTGVACHEYGHNFGLLHANYWITTSGSAISGGTHEEYGDTFDTMGSANAGDYQFNAFEKNLLNWLPTTLVNDVTVSGTYRIYQMDQPTQNPRLRYAIKTRKDVDRDYWIDLRQLFTSNAWVQGGIFLHWSPWASSGGGSHLLDTTPGSIDGKTDAPIVIGRTFSDLETGIHITPIAKNASTPPSADVVVNLGMFPGNSAPVVAVGASVSSAATNVAIIFTATASDPDGDVMSYAWDYGDKSFSTTNSPVVSKSWATAGEYRVRCTASDMKGKTTSASVIVTVGTPATTYRIAGTITAGGQPLANVRVHNSLTGTSYREAYTDADGTYTLMRLAAATYTVATQLYGYTLTPTASASVTVGPSKTGVNFTASDTPQVSIAVQDADCAEGANTGAFRISRTGSTAAALAVSLYYPSGTATKGSDYSLTPDVTSVSPFYTLTIPAGAAFLDVILTATDDTAVESFESVILELVPSTSYVLGTATATIWIADSDTANPLVRLKVTDRDADESGDSGQFVIERLGATTSALNVSVALSGTAVNGTDYATIPTTITIPAGASSVPVNVTPLQDTIVETMETVILTISTNAAYTRAASTVDYIGTVNLHDDDQPVLTVVATDSAAAEAGNDPGVFTVTRTGSTAAALTVNYGLTGSALQGTDYVSLPGVLTIPAGSSVGTVVITPIDDNIGEPAQTVVFQLRGGIGYTVENPSNATVTITDNDLPYAVINVTTGPAIEGGTAGVFRVTTTGTGTGNINVLYTVTGTATNGTDYTALSGSVTMAKNTTSNITISPIQDSLVEGYETVTITLTPDPAYTLAVDSSATMNLQDDDAPQVNVSTTDDAFTESNGSLAKFFVSRTGSTTSALTVNYTLGGTATAGVDYTAPSGSVTIAATATGAYVDVSMLSDTLAEGTETIVLNVTPASGYAVGIGSATRYITDSQSPSVTTQVGFSAATSSASENAGTVNIPVTLSAAAASTVTVEYIINGGTALGGGVDYSLTAGVFTFLPGETTKNIQVVINDDTVTESNETLVIALTNPNNAKLGTSSHTLTITDNDAPPGVTVGFAGTTGSGLESQSPAPLTVALSTAQAAPVTVDYAVTGGTATSGGTDYAITAGTLTFAAGETVKVIPNTIVDDASPESSETIILTLSNPVGAVLSANSTFTYTITDNDAATVTIVATDASAAEPGTDTGLFTITRTGSTTAALTVNFSIGGTATSGADYANLPTSVVIAAGASSATVLVTPLDDNVIEPAETVVLTLAPGIYTIGAANSATVTIADDEVNVIVTIVASDASAAELNNPGEFTVTRAGSTQSDLPVNLSITGTATNGVDYTTLATSVVIPAAATSVVIPVSPLTDSLNEGDETVILTVLAGSGYSRGAPGSATVTIANTDDGSPPTLAPSSIVDDKGGASVNIDTLVTYTVTFNKDMDASTVTAADFGNAGTATVTIGSVTETSSTSGVFTVQATPTNAGTLQLKVNAGAVLKSVAGTNLDTTTAIADNTIITVAGYAPLALALDTTGLTWATSGNANWINQSTTTHDGVDAAQSGTILDNQSSSMETTVAGPGTLTFWWKVSSESNYDYLQFYLNGVEQASAVAISGTVDWVQKTVAIPSGSQIVKWTYSKDSSVSSGSDAAWVDQFVFTPTTAPEIAVEQPVNTGLVDGSASISCGSVNVGSSSSPVTFTVKNLGTADLTGLSISKDGTNNADYVVGALGTTTLTPGNSTTFTVTFSPSASGARSAAIHIASNDADENPFDIALTGTGLGLGNLVVTGAGGLTSSGNYGGPFSPSSLQYTLSNPGSTSINWTAAQTAGWVSLDATSGTLTAGGNTTVTVSINSAAAPAGTGGKLRKTSATLNSGANSLNAGAYSDTVSFTNTTNGTGNTTRAVALTVNPAPATVTLSGLSPTYDGASKPVTVTTNPASLANSVTYNGSATAPINAGTYAVVATITDPNYTGSASGSLVVAKASQTITFAPLSNVLDNSAPFALTATVSSGLTVSYTSSNPAVATVSGNTVTVTGVGSTTITASQAGNTNYNAATSVQQTLTVVRANPLAVTGGPYKVLFGQSLSLNGGGSFPSNGQSITTYEWDLNNDSNFADATGATPASISFNTLIGTWGMVAGLNTIQLKVTDSANKTSIVSTTVELVFDLTWDANAGASGQTNGLGVWLGTNQWWDGSGNQTWAAGSNAIFGGPNTAGGAVTLASPTSVNFLTFKAFTGTYTLGTAGQAITINGGITANSTAAAVSIISPVAMGGAQTWTNNSASALTASGNISGSGDLTKLGTGTVILSPTPDTSDYTGTTIISTGVLNIQKATALGSSAAGTSVASGAALQIQGLITVGAEALTLNGTGVLNTGALRNINSANIYGGLVTLAGDTRINSDAGSLTLSNTGTITGAGLALTLGGAGNITINSIIGTINGTLTKDGVGTLTLSGANTYSGGTVINGGNLTLTSSADMNLGATNGSFTLGAVTVNANATINLPAPSFIFNRPFILNNGASLITNATSAVVIVNGAVTGTGSIAPFNQSGASLTLTNTANSFTGNIQLASGIQQGTIIVNSIGDGGIVYLGTQTNSTSSTYGTANFRYGTGANAPLVLNSRQFQLGTSTSGKGVIQNDNTANSNANTITINTDLLSPWTTSRLLELGGANTGNNTFAGKIIDGAGTVSLQKAGAGKWVLSGSNNYSGTTTISAGTLNIQNASALGTTAGGTSVTNGATLQLQGGISYAAEALTLGTGASGNSLLQNDSGDNTWNGTIGTSGIVASSFVRISSNLGLLTLAGTITGNDAGTSIVLQGASAITVTGQITGTSGLTAGSVNAGAGSIRTLCVSNNYTGPTTISGGTLQLGDGNIGKDGTIENTSGITNNATLVFNRYGDLSSSVSISGSGAVTKTGTGSQTLSGPNSYLGATTVSAGKLFINGNQTSATGAVSVSGNATLGGTGIIGGNTTVAANGRLEFNLSTNSASHDRLDLAAGKTLTFSGASVLTITSSGGVSPGTYTLITAPGGITGSAPATLNVPSGWAATTSISGNSLVLTILPGPVDHFAISAISSSQTVGTPITGITLTAQDASNNTATGFTGTVTFGGTGGFTGTSASFTAGVLTGVSVTPTVPGSNLTFTVNDGAGHTGSTTIGTIVPGAVHHFAISAISSSQTVGTPITGITLTAQDVSNNTSTSFTGTVTFGGTGGFTGTSAAFVSGVLTGVSVTPHVAGSNLTFTVNDGSSHTGSATIGTISSGNTFASWIGNYPGVGSLTAFGDDPDNDGIPNGLENFFGTAPNAPNAANARLSAGVLTKGANTTYTFSHPQNPTPASDVSAAAYGWSTDLQNYYASGATVAGTTVTFAAVLNTPSTGTTTVTATITGTVPARFFVKLAVTKQ